MGIIQFSIFLRNTHQNQTLKSSSCTPCTLLLLLLWPLPALLKPPSSLELPLLLLALLSFLALPVLPPLLSLEVLPSLRDLFLEPLLNVERDLLKMNKMLLSLS